MRQNLLFYLRVHHRLRPPPLQRIRIFQLGAGFFIWYGAIELLVGLLEQEQEIDCNRWLVLLGGALMLGSGLQLLFSLMIEQHRSDTVADESTLNPEHAVLPEHHAYTLPTRMHQENAMWTVYKENRWSPKFERLMYVNSILLYTQILVAIAQPEQSNSG